MTEQLPFGEWLRKQRRALDLSRQQLADQAGCAEITLRRIEGGTLKPSTQLASILLEKVGIPKNELDEWVLFARGQAEIPTREKSSIVIQPNTNLPAQITSFIGREKEQAETIALINKHRLVSLLGMGGVGKTRLSIRVGESMLKDLPNGVWMVELAPLTDPNLIPQAAASIFSLSATPTLTVTQVLINYLRSKKALLILDNCEHVLDASAQLADTLLKNCPALKILTTSREPLGILGEASYQLPSLELPDTDRLMNAFRDFASVRLFEERAQLVQMDFSLTMENASFAAQICHRLDGIPLAIELAAVHVNQFSVAEIVSQLDEAFQILTGGSRTALPRQQTIRASIDWSWNLLNEQEKTLMRNLAIFAGGWTIEAARSVCGVDVIGLTNSLVKKSLIFVNQASGREKRYNFHEVVRQYAYEKLVESNESESLRQKYLDYFVSLAEQADAQLHGADQNLWLERLTSAISNMRKALEYAFESDMEIAVRLSAALGWFWFRLGLLSEGRDWYEKILASQSDLSLPSSMNDDSLHKAFYGAGLLAHYQGNYAYARKMLEQSLILAQKKENSNGIAHAMTLLSAGYAWEGDLAIAEKYSLESIELFKTSGEVWGQAFALNSLGFSFLVRGDFTRAYSVFGESVNRAREAGDRYILAFPLSNLGTIAYQQGDLTLGKELLEESLAIARWAHDPLLIGWALKELGHIAQHQGDFARAKELYEDVLEKCRTTEFKAGVAEMLRSLGNVAVKTNEYQKAQTLIQESLRLFQSQGDVRNVVYCLNSFASLAGATADWALAVKLLSFVGTQLKAMGLFMSPIDKSAFDQLLEDTRQHLEENVFAESWAKGASMNMEQAIQVVL